jgi:hypothetical protein
MCKDSLNGEARIHCAENFSQQSAALKIEKDYNQQKAASN